jgi:hypothetical protein
MSTSGGVRRASTDKNAGAHAPLSARLPSAAQLERSGNNNGPYGRDAEETMPEQSVTLSHYAAVLGAKPAFQAMVNSVLDNWQTERHGFHHNDPNAFSHDYFPAEKAMWAVFSAYDSVSRHGEMNPLQVALQDAAKAEFGLRGAADTANSAEKAKAQQSYAAAQPGLRLVLRQMYNETQTWLASRGITQVPLFRGTRFVEGNQPRGVAWNNKVQEREISSRPLSSWATNMHTAGVYARAWSHDSDPTYHGYGLTSAAMVPASRIFSVENVGLGRAGEAEVVVLGGADRAMVKAENPIETINTFDDHDLLREFGGR